MLFRRNGGKTPKSKAAGRRTHKGTIIARMTDEETEALDKYYTENTIMPVKGKPGFFAERKAQIFAVDALSAQYFMAKAAAEHKTPAEIIGKWCGSV
jgi:hypothetical protein